jgi:PAS domain S-box-containing protein
VRGKLLLILAVLSLPLLIISLIQLSNYRSTLDQQAQTITRIQLSAAAGTLNSFLEDHPLQARGTSPLSPSEIDDLRERLKSHVAPASGTAIAVYDSKGQPVSSAAEPRPDSTILNTSSDIAGYVQWSDGARRITSVKRVDPFGWYVTVGASVSSGMFAGQSNLTLAATWALTLIASILIAIWAVGRFTNPLRQLASSVSTLGDGGLDERVKVETEDEVGALARSVNTMAEQLETKFEEVQTQGAFIEEVLDGLPLAVAVLDAKLIVSKVNSAFARAVDRDASALTGRGLYEAAGGLAVLSDIVEDVRRTRCPFISYGLSLELLARNDETSEEAELKQYWDVTIWPTSEKSVTRGDLILILSEVSRRVRAERLATSAFASERSRAAELQSLINQMNEGVVIIDRFARYKINPAAAEIIGRRSQDLRDGAKAFVADIALQNLDGTEVTTEETPFMQALDRRESVSGKQFRVTRPDGEQRVVAISATPLVSDGGTVEGAVAVFRDITEEVMQHSQLVSAYDQLREHDRLKSAFVTNVTHELRTPLNVIIGLCQLLERDKQMPLASLQIDAVTRMERNARSLLDLVNDLLDYSRLEAGRAPLHVETFDVGDVLQEVVNQHIDAATDKRVRLHLELSPGLGNITTDKHKFEQVLTNLIGNAVKFTLAGEIRVAAKPVDQTHWSLEVTDTGIGISNDALTYIFDVFRQVDDRLARTYGGTGLGLAITKKIVELLEGEISVESTLEEGSRFLITWPRKIQSPREADNPSNVVRAGRFGVEHLRSRSR